VRVCTAGIEPYSARHPVPLITIPDQISIVVTARISQSAKPLILISREDGGLALCLLLDISEKPRMILFDQRVSSWLFNKSSQLAYLHSGL